MPKEHGAYGQLLVPLVSALLIGVPTAGAYLLAAAGTAAFLAHEGLLVQVGQRGSRAAREQQAEARRSLALFGGFAAVTGTVSLFTLPTDALVWLGLPIVLGLAVAVAVFAHVEKTTGGEVLVGAALSSLSMPVALGGEATAVAARTLFLVFALIFMTATVAVRAMIGRVTKAGGPPRWLALLLAPAVLAVLAWLAARAELAEVAPMAAIPVCVVSFALSVKPPSPRYLRPIGWTLVAATILTAIILVVGERLL
ncbi:MAG: YwiC-like family protein [Vicinamibacterales bacterium]